MIIKILYMLLFAIVYATEIKYLDFEHPKLASFDPEYITNVSMKSSRLSRSDNTHYFDFNITILKPVDKEINLNILFQQQNTILPNAILLELQYRLCDILNENNIILKQFKDAFYRIPKEIRPMRNFKCPFRTGTYSYTKMGMPAFILPNDFPVLDGRITVTILFKTRVLIKVSGMFHVK